MEFGVGGPWYVELWDKQSNRITGQASTITADISFDGDDTNKTQLEVSPGVPRNPLDSGEGQYRYDITPTDIAGALIKAKLFVRSSNTNFIAIATPRTYTIRPPLYSRLDLELGGQGKAWMNLGKYQDSGIAAAIHRALLGAGLRAQITASGTTFVESTDANVSGRAAGSFTSGPTRIITFFQGTNAVNEIREISNYTALIGPDRGRFEWVDPIPGGAPEVGTEFSIP